MQWLRRIFGPPDQDAFAALVTRRLRAAGVGEAIAYQSEEFSLEVGEGDERRTLYLGNVYAETLSSSRAERRSAIDQYLRAADTPDLPKRFEEASDSILPRVRDRAYFPLLGLRFAGQGDRPIDPDCVVLAEQLSVNLVYDLPDAIVELTEPVAQKWDVSFDEALEAALRNLRERSQEPFVELAEGVYQSPWQDAHDASRMVLPELFYRMSVLGDPVATVPNRDVLLVTGSRDEQGLALVAQLTAQALEHPRLLTGGAFRLCDGVWAPFVPETAELAERYRGLRRSVLARDYAEQKQLLDATHEAEGKDVFVASLSGFRDESTGSEHSYCVWSRGVDSLLPESDVLAFYDDEADDEGKTLLVPWAIARERVGVLLEPTDFYPLRWRARGYPSADQIAALRASALG